MSSSTTSTSSNVSSERIYDFEYMMKLAASSASAMSSTSTLNQLTSDEDVSEILKSSSQPLYSPKRDTQEYSEGYEHYEHGSYDSDSEDDEEEYGSWYDIRTDLSEDLLDELRDAVYDAISLTLPLSPESETVPLPALPALPFSTATTAAATALPQRSLQALLQEQEQQQQKQKTSSYSAPIVQQSRTFATLTAKRQTQTRTQQAQRSSNAFKAPNAHNSSTAFSWRREVPRNPRNSRDFNIRETIRSNVNVNTNTNTNTNAVSSWRKTTPGTEWKWNEETSGYTLIRV